MKQSIMKFLTFKGKTLLFLAQDGGYYIAIKCVCEALGVNYNRQFQNISEDPILGSVFAVQQMQIPGDQLRGMACLPERYIYGWIFSIRSESKELIEYKRECYEILFNHFHGTITDRHELLTAKVRTKARISELVTSLNENPAFTEWQDLKAEEARLGIAFKQLDQRELREVADLFTGTSEIL
jgi:hypothetical protein